MEEGDDGLRLGGAGILDDLSRQLHCRVEGVIAWNVEIGNAIQVLECGPHHFEATVDSAHAVHAEGVDVFSMVFGGVLRGGRRSGFGLRSREGAAKNDGKREGNTSMLDLASESHWGMSIASIHGQVFL